MNHECPECPYCEKGVLVPTSDYLVPWICTACGSSLTRKGGLYGPAEPVWYTRDGLPLRFLADPKASAIVHPVVEAPSPVAAPEAAAPAEKADVKKGKAKK